MRVGPFVFSPDILLSMDLHTFLVLLHVIGTVLGVGGATMAEVNVVQALRDGKVDVNEKRMMHANYTVIRVGTVFILISAALLVWWHLSQGNTWVLTSGKVWAKEIMTIAIVVNAVALSRKWVPLWLGASISFVSWWAATILGVWRQVPFSFWTILMTYIVTIGVAAFLLHHIRNHFIAKGV